MKTLRIVNLVLLIFLGVASGVSKIMQIQQEMEFFQGEMGFGTNTITAFGVTQLVAGALLIFGKTRKAGAMLLAITLIISTAIIFAAGKIGFGLFSIVPIAMAAVVIWENTGKPVVQNAEDQDNTPRQN